LDGAKPRLLCDATGRIVGVNAAWSALCGYTEKEAVGKTPAMLQGPLTDLTAAKAFARVLRCEGAATATLLNRKKDGSYFRHRLTGEKIGQCFIAESRVLSSSPEDSVGNDGNHCPSLVDDVVAVVCVLIVLLAMIAAAFPPYAAIEPSLPPAPPPGMVQNVMTAAKGVVRHIVPTGMFVGLATLANWDMFLLGGAALVTGL